MAIVKEIRRNTKKVDERRGEGEKIRRKRRWKGSGNIK